MGLGRRCPLCFSRLAFIRGHGPDEQTPDCKDPKLEIYRGKRSAAEDASRMGDVQNRQPATAAWAILETSSKPAWAPPGLGAGRSPSGPGGGGTGEAAKIRGGVKANKIEKTFKAPKPSRHRRRVDGFWSHPNCVTRPSHVITAS